MPGSFYQLPSLTWSHFNTACARGTARALRVQGGLAAPTCVGCLVTPETPLTGQAFLEGWGMELQCPVLRPHLLFAQLLGGGIASWPFGFLALPTGMLPDHVTSPTQQGGGTVHDAPAYCIPPLPDKEIKPLFLSPP